MEINEVIQCIPDTIRNKLLGHLTIEIDPSFPTAGVKVERGKMTLVVGALWEKATTEERRLLILHEISHLVRGDLGVTGVNPSLANVSMDAIINQVLGIYSIGGIEGVRWDTIAPQVGLSPEVMTSWRDLYNKLKDKVEQMSFDFIQSDGTEESKQKVVEVAIDLRDVVPEEMKKGTLDITRTAGSSGGQRKFEAQTVIPPQEVALLVRLLNEVGTYSTRSQRSKSWRRVRDLGVIEVQSKVYKSVNKFAFIVDASGSMEGVVPILLGVVKNFERDYKFETIIFDTEAKKFDLPPRNIEGFGGGTTILPAIELVSPDVHGVIILSDFDFFEPSEKINSALSKFQHVFAVVPARSENLQKSFPVVQKWVEFGGQNATS